MQIKADVTLPFPRETVFITYRDHLAELTEFLPNIRSIRVIKREDLEGEVRLVNAWVGGGDIPAAARAVIKESMLSWTDHATWKSASYTVEWRTEVGVFPGVVRSSGFNRYVEDSRGTRLEIRGDLVCDASKIPGVPRLLAGTVNGAIEKFLVNQVQVNLVEVGKGVGRFLERKAK